MAFCVSCGQALVDGARFCSGCGRDLTPAEPEPEPLAQTMAHESAPTSDPSATPTLSPASAAPQTGGQNKQPEMWPADLTSAGAAGRRSVNVRILALVAGVCILGLVGYLVISGLLGHAGAGGSLGVNQKLTVDASTKSVTLVVDKKEEVAIDAIGDRSSPFEGNNQLVQIWNARGIPVNGTSGHSLSTGLFVQWFELTPGQYKITWSKKSIPDNGKVTIEATAYEGAK
jgi:zinc-ribbon domain